jgi:hypothetical protein
MATPRKSVGLAHAHHSQRALAVWWCGRYEEMYKRCGLVVAGSKTCDVEHLDLIFTSSNSARQGGASGVGAGRLAAAKHRRASKVVQHDTRHGLSRAELVACLLRVAVARYVLSNKSRVTSVAAALDELFRTITCARARRPTRRARHFVAGKPRLLPSDNSPLAATPRLLA